MFYSFQDISMRRCSLYSVVEGCMDFFWLCFGLISFWGEVAWIWKCSRRERAGSCGRSERWCVSAYCNDFQSWSRGGDIPVQFFLVTSQISKSTIRPLSHSTKTCFFPRIPFIDDITVIEIAFGDRKWRSSRGLGF